MRIDRIASNVSLMAVMAFHAGEASSITPQTTPLEPQAHFAPPPPDYPFAQGHYQTMPGDFCQENPRVDCFIERGGGVDGVDDVNDFNDGDSATIVFYDPLPDDKKEKFSNFLSDNPNFNLKSYSSRDLYGGEKYVFTAGETGKLLGDFGRPGVTAESVVDFVIDNLGGGNPSPVAEQVQVPEQVPDSEPSTIIPESKKKGLLGILGLAIAGLAGLALLVAQRTKVETRESSASYEERYRDSDDRKLSSHYDYEPPPKPTAPPAPNNKGQKTPRSGGVWTIGTPENNIRLDLTNTRRAQKSRQGLEGQMWKLVNHLLVNLSPESVRLEQSARQAAKRGRFREARRLMEKSQELHSKNWDREPSKPTTPIDDGSAEWFGGE